MRKIKNVIILVTVLLFTNSIVSQVEPLYNYDIIDVDDYNGYSEYRLQGKSYYRYSNEIEKNKDVTVYSYDIVRVTDTIYNVKTEDITFFSILKKRYLFVSFYPKEQKGLSFGFSIRKLRRVDVIDLKYPTRKWYFDLEGIIGASLDGIYDFKPKQGEIIFNYKFSVDTSNKSTSIIPRKNIKGF